MIPTLPPEISEEATLKFYDTLITQYESMSEGHKIWYTHKREHGLNCWICDLLLLSRKMERELEAVISKSTLDTSDMASPEINSLNLNYNEEENGSTDNSTGSD